MASLIGPGQREMPREKPAQVRDTALVPGDFFVVRTPLLPFEDFLDLSFATGVAHGSQAHLDAAKEKLRRFYDRPEVSEALHIASHSLWQRLTSRDARQTFRKDRKLHTALYKYASRMTYRSTPFGLFAGVSCSPSMASDGTNAGVWLSARDSYRRHSRMDMGAVGMLVSDLMKLEQIRHAGRYSLNPTMYRFGENWHFIQPRAARNVARSSQQAFVEASPAIDCIVNSIDTAGGLVAFHDLAAALRNLPEAPSQDECTAFIDVLIENEILLSNLEPALTGDDALAQLAAAMPAASPSQATISRLQQEFANLNRLTVGAGLEASAATERQVRELLTAPERMHVMQTDLFKPIARAALPQSAIDEITRAVRLLSALTSRGHGDLSAFRDAFCERYGDRAVPLLVALDADLGIPFGAGAADQLPLLAGIPLQNARTAARSTFEPQQRGQSLSQFLLTAFERACRENLAEIALDEPLTRQWLAQSNAQLPTSLFALVNVLPNDGTSSGAPHRIVVRSVGGPSGINLISRFCSMDSELTAWANAHLAREASLLGEQSLVAEIIHRPVGRIENVLVRPILRSHEIPILGRAAVAPDRQIALRDLLVSVEGERVVLRSSRSQQLVLPRLTSAHNHRIDAVPVYRFLAALQMQGDSIGPFAWPSLMMNATRLPRVVYGNCILSPQTWHLSAQQLELLRPARARDAQMQIAAWRSGLSLPRFIELVDGDNCLLVDLDNPVAVECLVEELVGRQFAKLQEAFIPDQHSFVNGPEGRYCHELLMPFLRADVEKTSSDRRAESPSLGTVSTQPGSYAPATHSIGSEWLYLKLYCGTSAGDRILARHLQPLVARLTSAGLIDKWFFLRYEDPEHHLRVRLHGTAAALWSDALAIVREDLQPVTADLLTWRMEASAYEPEVERYGGPHGLAIAEQMFCADSACALALLQEPSFVDPDLRWAWIACSVDRLWDGFGFDSANRETLYASLARQLQHRYSVEKSTKVAIDRRFRSSRALLDKLLRGDAAPESTQQVLAARDRQIRSLSARLHELAKQHMLSRSVQEIATSVVHMSVNRLCLHRNTPHELVIYELLKRLHAANRARGRRSAVDSDSGMLTSNSEVPA